MNWKLLTGLVCLFGFLKEYRPSEAYLTAYLTGPWKNLTIEEVDNEIYPIWTYAYLVWLIPVFLLTDYLRYKPMLFIEGAAYIATWSVLLWARGVLAFKFMEVLFGLVTATEVAYYSYLFSVVSKDHYKIISSVTRSAILMGRFAAYLTGQLLVSFDLMDYFQLNYISFGSVIIVTMLALFFPKPAHSDIFHNTGTNEIGVNDTQLEKGVKSESPPPPPSRESIHGSSFKGGIMFLIDEIKAAYSDRGVITWSIWWAFASCGHLQVQNYVQNLWQVIATDDHDGNIYNGAVEAFGTLVSSLSVLAIGFIPINWSRTGVSDVIMVTVCALNAAVLTIMGMSTEIWVVYALYSVFRATYQTVITIATLQIAKSLSRRRYGFVFGANMFMALVVETILTVILVDNAGFGVDVHTQFVVYGVYFGVIGCLFLIAVIVIKLRQRFAADLVNQTVKHQ